MSELPNPECFLALQPKPAQLYVSVRNERPIGGGLAFQKI